jgi:hypothetical protein
MKILINESQVRFLMREFGESVSDRDVWLEGIYQWTDKPMFEYSGSEIIAYGSDNEYLGYWDDEQSIGFVVTEYIMIITLMMGMMKVYHQRQCKI